MKILMLADARSPHTVAIANNLARRGTGVKVVSFSHAALDFLSNVEVNSLGVEASPDNDDLERAAAVAQNIIDTWKPTFVNSHYVTEYGRVAYRLRNCRHIASVWGSDILLRPRRSAADLAIVQKALSEAIAVFATSNTLAKAARPFTEAPIFNTPFGVDIVASDGHEPRPYTDGGEGKAPIILTCAKALRTHYGLDTAIETVAVLKRRGVAAKLRLAGDGPLKEELVAQAARYGVDAQVEFCGWLERERVPDFHRSGHLGFYPSRHESFGVSLLESLYYGSPVVASHVGGIPEVLWSTEYSRMRTPDDAVGFANAIQTLVAEKGGYERASRAAHEHAKQFLWDRTIEYYLAGLNTLAETSRSMRNMTFPGPQQIDDAHKKGLCVFHYPGSIKEAKTGARMVRIHAIMEALAERFSVVRAAGRGVGATGVSALLKFYQGFGVKPLFAYAEGHSVPYMSFDSLRNFDWTFSEYRFLRKLRRAGIPVVWFVRDAHAAFSFYARILGRREFLKRKILFRMDLAVIGRIAKRIAVPSPEFAKRLPRHVRRKSFPLPPGTSLAVGGYRQSDRIRQVRNGTLKIIYAGGLGANYDKFPFFGACHVLARSGYDIEIGLFCRREEYAAYSSLLAPFWVNKRFKTYHADASRIDRESRHYNLASLALRPTQYQKGAYPLKCYSYAAAGLPILCSSSVGFSEVINSEEIGWTTSGSVLDIARTLFGILEDPDGYARVAANVHNFRFEQTWSRRVDEIYAQAVGKDRAVETTKCLNRTERKEGLKPVSLPPNIVEYCHLMQERVDAASIAAFGETHVLRGR